MISFLITSINGLRKSEDQEIAAGISEGNSSAYERLFYKYSRNLLDFAFNHVKDKQLKSGNETGKALCAPSL